MVNVIMLLLWEHEFKQKEITMSSRIMPDLNLGCERKQPRQTLTGSVVTHVDVMDSPDEANGNACHEYDIMTGQKHLCTVKFQNGPVTEAGVNGVTHEDLLAIIIHRLQGFQSGPFACRDNDMALAKAQECLAWLNNRTKDRISRGVEGKNKS